MRLNISPRARKQLSKLPKNIQKKTKRQLEFLLTNYRHPSLRTRKMGGSSNFEARIDIHYRLAFRIQGDIIYILVIGPHDEGLGKN